MSSIEWTDQTINVQIGCSRKSPGCEHCYAETLAQQLARRFKNPGHPASRYLAVVDGEGRWNREVVLDTEALSRPPRIPKRKRDGYGWRPPRVFLGSMTDHFHESVTDEMFTQVIGWMSKAPAATWQLVTKRPERAVALLGAALEKHWESWPRIHLLATAEDQRRADERVPDLLNAASMVELVGLSMEPLLGPVDIPFIDQLGWVIVGGESGTGARPCHDDWICDIIEQATDARVPVFVKQLGAQPVAFDGEPIQLKDAKGGDWEEWPSGLRWRQWP